MSEAKKKIPIGPPVPSGSRCKYGLVAECECQGCRGTFCALHWWRHSHTNPAAKDYQPLPTAEEARHA